LRGVTGKLQFRTAVGVAAVVQNATARVTRDIRVAECQGPCTIGLLTVKSGKCIVGKNAPLKCVEDAVICTVMYRGICPRCLIVQVKIVIVLGIGGWILLNKGDVRLTLRLLW
jgi:hypothetical protein